LSSIGANEDTSMADAVAPTESAAHTTLGVRLVLSAPLLARWRRWRPWPSSGCFFGTSLLRGENGDLRGEVQNRQMYEVQGSGAAGTLEER
jgi:hypothetical protein